MAIRRTLQLNTGFTLVEMMISIVIISIMLTVVVPLGAVVETFRLDYFNQRVYSSAFLARSEAIKRGVPVSLCRTVTGADCDTGDTDWASGWLVFTNPNNNNSVDTGEEIIRVYNAINTSLRLTLNAGTRLTFVPRGNPVTNNQFTLCIDGRLGGDLNRVIVSVTGQIRKDTGTGNCT